MSKPRKMLGIQYWCPTVIHYLVAKWILIHHSSPIFMALILRSPIHILWALLWFAASGTPSIGLPSIKAHITKMISWCWYQLTSNSSNLISKLSRIKSSISTCKLRKVTIISWCCWSWSTLALFSSYISSYQKNDSKIKKSHFGSLQILGQQFACFMTLQSL